MFYYVRSSPCHDRFHDDYLTYPAPSFHLMTSSSSFLTPQAIKSNNSHKNSSDNCTPSKFLAPTTRTVYTTLLISGTGNWEEGEAGAPHNSLAPLKNVISCMNTANYKTHALGAHPYRIIFLHQCLLAYYTGVARWVGRNKLAWYTQTMRAMFVHK